MSRTQLHFSGVGFTYPGTADPVLRGLAFSLPPGWTGVVGANGAGKTTCLHLAAGLLVPDAGRILGGGGLVCAQRMDDPPEGTMAFLAGDGADAWAWRHRLGIEEDWGRRWETLSHGERKRLQLAVALWRNPPLLAVDEPTNHVDLPTTAMVREALAAFQGIGLLVSHDRELLDALCARCLFLESGRGTLLPVGYSEGERELQRQAKAHLRVREVLDRERRALEAEQVRRRDHAAIAERTRSKRGLAPGDHDGRARVLEGHRP